ncbi:MAG TPA: Asp-tRNA(Asn)/Glu-tRNA(Gln) amidotransferase subunit GatB [Chitinivibrionales bacterium]|jgi:aspartyl-tRNA(Asn)/glutamyl-tRNA(Gln) amidotransferase subunit B|nr:Asp-tRNA(Asn)/Glu-tRNA(Gln) amidotransferase subunit GatB [Chitinivibrionales bacterium]
MEFETVIGLEIHAELLTKTKIFCGCAPKFGDAPNTHGCPVCLGLPGSLPVLNRRAVEMTILMGLAVGCSIARNSIFARKNYFYPDLPKGYQISQYDMPLCAGGSVAIEVDGVKKTVRINRIHLEEDAGKLIHDQDEDSLFDVNRCGTPLIEIVTEPDLRTAQEAYAYLTAIKQILDYLGICDCNMEEGSLRCDANISIRPAGEEKLGTKIELKNMNTFRGVEKALAYEALRQRDAVLSGETIVQQTFRWDPDSNRTVVMRTKEEAHDYRYFPEPDLLPLVVEAAWIEKIKKDMPELPAQKRSRFIADFGVTAYMAEVLTLEPAVARYFEDTLAFCKDAKLAANWVMGEVLRIVKEKKIGIDRFKVSVAPMAFGRLLTLVSTGAISANAAKKVLDTMEGDGKDPDTIVKEQGLSQISDSAELSKVVIDIVEKNPKEAQRYRTGETKLAGFFVGQVMRATGGKGNPKEISRLVAELLGKGTA